MAYWVTGSIPPFDDTRQPPPKVVFTKDPHTDTTEFDQYRQGIEIRTTRQLYGSNQPKIWGGTVDNFGRVSHEQSLSTPGQAVSFTEFYNTSRQEDLPKFNPVLFLNLGYLYPVPLWTNNGPQQEQEAIIEPFPVPFRLTSIEGSAPFRGVHASVDLTNVQIIPDPSTSVFGNPFLDQGRDLFGSTITGSIVLPNYASPDIINPQPFSDVATREVVLGQIISIDATFKSVLLRMTGSLQGDLNPLLGRSSCAGSTSYGPNIARYGTQGILFDNWLRGS